MDGISCRLDKLGRLVIPKVRRKELNILDGATYMEIVRNGNELYLTNNGESSSSEMGVCKKVDELGRVVIPKPLRVDMKLMAPNLVEVSKKGEKLVLSLKADRCCICGQKREKDVAVTILHKNIVCNSCKQALVG